MANLDSTSSPMTNGWLPIESAGDGWRTVSMRDVEREPPVWRAQRGLIRTRCRKYGRHATMRQVWFDEDGLICAPTHYLAGASP